MSKPKKSEQDLLLELQFNLKDKTRILDILTSATLILFIFAFCILAIVIPDKTFSPEENRSLQTFPEFSVQRLVDGTFISEIGDFYSDQLPLRNWFVGLKGIVEIGSLKQQNNEVTAGADGYIVERSDFPDYDMVQTNLNGIYSIAPVLGKLDIPYTVALAGRPVDVLERYLPALYPREYSEKFVNYVKNDVVSHSSELQYIDLYTPLKAMVDDDSNPYQIYYRTDHHWTTYGAYFAYCDIVRSWGLEPQPLENFTIEVGCDAFYGTTWRKAGMKWVKPEELLLFRYDGDDNFTTTNADNGTSFDGFYDRSYLEMDNADNMDKYSTFIGGNHGLTYVTKKELAPGETRQKLLIFKDSYSHCMIPFLAYHYDLVIVDLRYYKAAPIDLIVSERPDRVMVLNYMGSLTDANVFETMRMSLSKVEKQIEAGIIE